MERISTLGFKLNAMKTNYLKIILGISLLVTLNSTKAQYQSLLGSNQTSWNIYNSEFAGEFTDSLVVCCDTLINTMNYKKIDYYKFYTVNSPIFQSGVSGILREDTITGKAWYFSTADTNERLIMDLSLSITDSFQIFDMNSAGGVFYKVDSIYTKNGKKHIRLDVIPNYLNGNSNEKFTMIEGVGPNIGILFSDKNWPINNPYLLCSYKNYNLEYQNSSSVHNGHCSSFETGIDIYNLLTKVTIYPNPTKNLLNIVLADAENLKIDVYAVDGKLIEQKTMNKTTTIDISKYQSGLYFINATNSKGEVYRNKFVKE